MGTNDLNKDFMEKAMEDAVWKELSEELAWSESLMERHKENIDWTKVSKNRNILWSLSMLENFKNILDWNILSGSSAEHLFSLGNLEKFEKYWNWSELSQNSSIKFNFQLIDHFVDNWVWKELINNWALDELYNEEFLNRYSRYMPASELQYSRLWSKIIDIKKEKLASSILSAI